jgi:SAM-dependent methyltransferase
MATEIPDKVKAEAFAEQMVGILNHASLALLISVGHQTKLFDTMSTMSPATSAQIAAAAGLNERYVREWLGAMVTGRIVEYDPQEHTYRLPPEHAAALTRAAGTGNFAQMTQYIALMGLVEEEVAESFRKGGGVPYARYPRFQRLMAEESGAIFDETLVQTTLPLVPGLIERLRAGIDVLDVGCGSGHAINLMAQAFPQSRFTGYDFSDEGVAAGQAEATRLQLPNATFMVRDISTLDEENRYDLITAFDTIHDQAYPARVLTGIAQALRPDGTFLMVDIAASSHLEENLDHPLGPMLYTISTMHCMTVSLALDGTGLGTVWGEQKAREMLAEAGFTQTDVQRVEGDILNNYYISRKG